MRESVDAKEGNISPVERYKLKSKQILSSQSTQKRCKQAKKLMPGERSGYCNLPSRCSRQKNSLPSRHVVLWTSGEWRNDHDLVETYTGKREEKIEQ